MVAASIQKFQIVCWQTQKYLYTHKASKHQSYRMAQAKGLRTTPCTVAAGISHTVRSQENGTALSGYGNPFQSHPSCCPKSPTHRTLPVPPTLLGAGGINVAIFPPVTLYILPDQGYHRHYTKSSNNCTKNKTTVVNKNKKQKPTIKPLGTLHFIRRSP